MEFFEDLADTARTTDTVTAGEIREAMTDALAVADALLGIDLPNLLDGIRIAGDPSALLTARSALSEVARFDAAVHVGWGVLLDENVHMAATAAANPLLLAVIADSLAALGVATSRVDAVAAVSAALAMESLIANGWSVEAMDAVAFNEALEAAVRFFAPLVDNAIATDATVPAVRLLAIAADTVTGADTPATAMQMAAELVDGMMLYATIRVGGDEYVGWVLNTETVAPSEYRNFPFESLANFKGRVFGAGTGGIFELVGDTDDGDPIQAFIRTGLSDFGTGKLKRLPDVYLGYAGNGDVVLKVITTSADGAKTEDWYRQAMKPAAAVREGRIQVGRGLKSRYWQFELCNTAGAAIEFADVRLRPLILDRRV